MGRFDNFPFFRFLTFKKSINLAKTKKMSKEKIQKQLEEAKADLATLKKMSASKDEIEFAENEVKELEEKLKNASDEKKTEPKKEAKVEPKKEYKPVKKSTSARIMRGGKRTKKREYEKKEKKEVSTTKIETRGRKKKLFKSPKKKISKGLSVVYNGKTYSDTDPEFCNILIKQLEERRSKRKSAPKKSTSLSAKVGDDIASSVVTAIKGAFKENKDEILDNKTAANKFIKVIERIEDIAERFAKDMRMVLTDSFKQKDFDKEFKEVDEVIKKIKETIKKSVEE